MSTALWALWTATGPLACLAIAAWGPLAEDRVAKGREGEPKVTEAQRLVIDLLGKHVGVVYEYDALLARLDGLDRTPVLRLDESDVEQCVVGPDPSPVIALHLTEAASARWQAVSRKLGDTLPFTVTLDGERLYAGVLYAAIGAAAIQTPVLHRSARGSRIVLFIGAVQGAAYSPGDSKMPGMEAAARRIDRPALRMLFEGRGALVVRPRAPSPLDDDLPPGP